MLSFTVVLKQSHYDAPLSITLLPLYIPFTHLTVFQMLSLPCVILCPLFVTYLFLLSIELPLAPTRKYFQCKPHSWSCHVCPALLPQHWWKQCEDGHTGSKDTGGNVCGAFSAWERIQFETTLKESITVKFICNWLLMPILFCSWIEAWL